jgi:hypothetical protein
MLSSFRNIFLENLTKRTLLTMKVQSKPIGQLLDQSSLSILPYSKVSCVEWRKPQIFISFRCRIIEETPIRTNFLDRTLTVLLQQWGY